MDKTYRVIAKDDLYLEPHSWQKGLDYEVIEKGDRIKMATDQGDTNFDMNKKVALTELFDNFH